MSLEIEQARRHALPQGAHAGEPPRNAALAVARFFGHAPTPPGATSCVAAAVQPRARATSARIRAMTSA
jgi:hypothetical protein